MFAPRLIHRKRFSPLNGVLTVAVIVPMILGALSSYRAVVQVRSLHLRASETILHGGSTVGVKVVTSGRTPVDVGVELVQGLHSDTLATLKIRSNSEPVLDPRSRTDSLSVTLTTAMIARFQKGPAVVRVTANGRRQFLRLPPPEVRTLSVEIP